MAAMRSALTTVVSIKLLFVIYGNHLVTCCSFHYLRRRLASVEGIVTIAVTLCVTVSVCPPSCLYHISTARDISLCSKSNVLYPVLSGYYLHLFFEFLMW